MRMLYRVNQFWQALFTNTDTEAYSQAQQLLTPAQWELFDALQPAERSHALAMYRKLLEQGETQPDLLIASLLHDVGKLRYRLNPLERAMIVLAKALLPHQVPRWGSLPPEGWESLPGWRKAFVLSEQHAAWGAELAHAAGVSPLTESLIRQHHQPRGSEPCTPEDNLLHKLWLVDNQS